MTPPTLGGTEEEKPKWRGTKCEVRSDPMVEIGRSDRCEGYPSGNRKDSTLASTTTMPPSSLMIRS